MEDFKAAVNDAMSKVIAEGVIEKAIKDQLTNTIKGIIEKELRDWSDFGKQLTEAVKRSLALNGELDLPSYNDAVMEIVRQQVAGQSHAIVQQQVAANLAKLLKPPPATIRLSELVELFKEFCKEQARYGCSCDSHGEVTVRIEERDGYRHIYLDDEPNKRRGECEIQLDVTPKGEVYLLRGKWFGQANALFGGSIYGFQKTLFDMKVAGTVIEFDLDEHELELQYELAED
jgi:hypothetical protein